MSCWAGIKSRHVPDSSTGLPPVFWRVKGEEVDKGYLLKKKTPRGDTDLPLPSLPSAPTLIWIFWPLEETLNPPAQLRLRASCQEGKGALLCAEFKYIYHFFLFCLWNAGFVSICFKKYTAGKKNDSVEMFKFLGPKPFLNIIFLKRKIIIMKSGLSSA